VSRSLTVLIGFLIWPCATAAQSPEPVESIARPDSPKPPEPIVPFPLADLEAAITRGTAYLCRTQNRDGPWGSPRWTGGVDIDPVPGAPHSFGTATTALCLEALLGAGETTDIKDAVAKAESFFGRKPAEATQGRSG
jgi:hypothetical protein